MLCFVNFIDALSFQLCKNKRMYSRRIKVNKKKPKPTKQKPAPGSNWGPRLALIERERALAGGAVLEEDEEELYDIQHELVYNVKKSAKQSQSHPHQQNTHSSNNSGGSGRSNHNDIDPVLRLGRSSSPNYYYNYSRRAAPNASGTRKISCPEPSSTRQYQKTQNHLQYQQHQRRASYVLGSSSGYCSGSVTTLSTCVNNGNPEPNFEQYNKPLTLIIPSQERYDCFNNGKKISKSQKLRNVEFDDFGVEVQSQDSFPSSSAYQSSGDEGEGEKYRHEKREMNRGMGPKRHFHNPMANMKSSSGGILQISTKEAVVQVHAPPPGSPQILLEDNSTDEPETLEIGAEENEINAKSNSYEGNINKDKTGQTITALAQGITMVYVPMEAENKGVNISVKDSDDNNMNDSEYGEDPLPEYNEPVDLPELGQHSDDCSGASTSSSSRGSASGGGGKVANEPEQDSLSSNFILKRKVPDQQLGADSLLDSFDSILFKPKPGEALSKSQERCQSQLPTLPEHKGIRKRPEQPPPLPPSNGSGHKPVEKQKNLRFALENLETVLNPSLRTLSSGNEQNEQQTPPPAPKKVLKKVTLSLPGADNISSRNHELLLNYEELNNCSSEILSCGHVRNDDYSTLSSLTSSAQEISDFDDLGSNHGANSNHSGDLEVASNQGGSGGESDAGSAKNNTSSNKSGHEPRSVLQQLRDLSRLIRGNSPTKHNAQQQQQQQKQQEQPQPPSKTKENSSHVHFTEANSFFLHRPSPSGEGEAKRKSSDATDNSADSGKGSGSGTSGSGSGSSGQEGSSSSAEPSPNNTRGGCGAPNSNCTSGVSAKIKHSRRLHIATIRGRGGGTGSHHHYTLCPEDEDDDGHCQEETCSQQSGCSCQECCDYRSDCNECQMYNKPPVAGFPKPSNSEELCSNEPASNGSVGGGVRKKSAPNSTPKTSRPPSRIVRRRSSRVTAVRRTASLKKSKFANANGGSSSAHNRKPVILDYCDCSNCDLADLEFEDEDEEMMHRIDRGCCNDKNCHPTAPPHHRHEPLLIPIKNSGKCKSKSRIPNLNVNAQGRKISTSSGSSGVSSASSAGKVSRISAFRSSAAASVKQQAQAQTQQQQHQSSQLLRQSDAALAGAALSNPTSVVPLPSAGNLFTIDEANEDSVYGESGTAVVIGKGARSTSKQQQQPLPAVPREFQLHHQDDEESFDENVIQNMPPKRASNSRSHTQHSHPKCWLAPDATLGWSDLESLYSQNMKVDGKAPPVLRDECPTCWKELSEMKKNCPDPNRTVDRTKRMFIWLNRRHKEFHAPWWEAKKQASMRWLVTKAFAHVPKDKVPDPFKESKKGKPTKYSLRDEIVKGLVTGKLYCMSLDSLYRSQQNNYHLSQNLTHWEIIKILSRRGIYIAQPSDMKLTETTLRQKKPIRTAAHIALIEAMMGLYAKEILGRDRIAATLRSFGKIIDPDTNSPERLVISWINTAVTTLKSYILSNAQQHLLLIL
ncbi:Patronin [Orchesella cincta]|uniref:Patronin n=1 Tax=Orchesella cincta TaxID=48709 RepID=A0A1D2MYF0_ORCCI|nr:Patronin [Orchesella cincta]